MMYNSLYFVSGISALGGLWVLWDVAFKSFFLDALRERVFDLRFQLFELGVSDELSFNSDTYRSLETLLNGVLRYAHRFTFLTYLFSAKEQSNCRKVKGYEDISQQLTLKISRIDATTQAKVRHILQELQQALALYIAFTSLLFLISAVVLATLRVLNIVTSISKKQVTEVFEQEAYNLESRQARLVAV